MVSGSKFVAASLSSVVVTLTIGASDAQAAPACRGADHGQAAVRYQESATMCLINERRARHRLSPLRMTPSVQRIARARNSAISRCSVVTHTPCGVSLEMSLSSHSRTRFRGFAENLALTARGSTPRRVVQLWMGSSRHRRALLDPRFSRAGLVTRNRGARFGSPTGVRLHTLVLVGSRAQRA